ncbi:hypothetical protein KP806_17520 [Paenibacillus sp. N4]|uniref:hypothetical protein n=1 Tax=Paenibacillus vietnamensis TaxID=2590547 RepID=UPI001CD11EE0|nr:hypothetical protein [Paenibacillus vietnamensis]MCA0756861.1 hypothetical protein [Paenibacillus vietnamensis]
MSSKRDCKSPGHKSRGKSRGSDCKSKGKDCKSTGRKDCDCKSDGSKGDKDDDWKKKEHGKSILEKIGVGTPNVRIQYDSASQTGVYLGIVGGNAVLSVDGVVTYIDLASVTAVSVGKRDRKKVCRKRKKVCKRKCRVKKRYKYR